MTVKNILYITYTLEPAGAERIIYSLATGIDRTRFRPFVCAIRRGGDLVERLERSGVKVFVLNKRRGFDPTVIGKLKKILLQERIDIIHAHNFSANFWGRVAGRLVNSSRIIATEHSLTTNKSWLQKKADYHLSRFTDRIIAVSEAVRQSHISTENIDPEKIITIYNGIDISQAGKVRPCGDVRRELRIKPGAPVVGIVARLTEPKGHVYFLETARRVMEKMPDTRFVMVGDGGLRKDLESLSENLGIKDSVIFTGFREDRLDITNAFDVAVLSSVREGLPVTLLEYMALKKPVVTTDVGGMSEVILDGVNGYVVPPADPDRLAAKITALLEDSGLRRRMGLNGYNMLKEKFTECNMLKSTEELYEKISRVSGD